MGRLIDADRLKAHYCWWENGTGEMTLDEAKKNFDTIIDLQPEAVTHCEDCIHGEIDEKGFVLCHKYSDWSTAMMMHRDDYCSLAEKKSCYNCGYGLMAPRTLDDTRYKVQLRPECLQTKREPICPKWKSVDEVEDG